MKKLCMFSVVGIAVAILLCAVVRSAPVLPVEDNEPMSFQDVITKHRKVQWTGRVTCLIEYSDGEIGATIESPKPGRSGHYASDTDRISVAGIAKELRTRATLGAQITVVGRAELDYGSLKLTGCKVIDSQPEADD